MSLKAEQIEEYICICIHKYFILSTGHIKSTSSATAEYYATISEDGGGITKAFASK